MSDRDGLLAAVLADPAADLPRLVYADYLDETGDALDAARAELIRAQVELARTPPDSPNSIPLRAAERRLLDLHTKALLAPLRAKGEPLQSAGTAGLFRRGFVEVVWMPALVYNRRATRLAELVPLRELRLTRARLEEVAAALGHPVTGGLAGLDLSGLQLGDGLAAPLVESAAWQHRLEVVRLRMCNLTGRAAEAILEVSAPQLSELDLAGNDVPDAWLERLRERYGAGAVRS